MAGGTNAKRALTIVLSLGFSVLIFTLLLKVTTAFIAVPALFWQILSGGLLIFFGLVMFWPALWEKVPGINSLYQNSNKLLGSGYQKHNFWGDVVMGLALGPVFSSCSPTYFVILAAVLPASLARGLAYLLAYIIGLCLFLFVIAYLGQKVVVWLGVASDARSWFKKTIGIIFIVIGLAVIFGLDKKLELSLPSGFYAEVGLEQKLLSSNNSNSNSSAEASTPTPPAIQTGSIKFLTPAEKSDKYQKAPELVAPDGYINTAGQPINLSQYLGKNVVLIDFWDYSCINCQRVIPYLNAWYKKYKDQGLVIIGVHTPEFAFEQLQSNVQAAVDRFGINYPVTLDNQYQTWNAFKNQYWPREYLIDIDGYIVHDHAGEGDYDGSEQAIQQALAERADRLKTSTSIDAGTVNLPANDLSVIQSPETYFGASRNEYLANGTPGLVGGIDFIFPNTFKLNQLYLSGKWNMLPEYAEASTGSMVFFKYSARDVYMVAVNPEPAVPVKIKVYRDGQLVGKFAGEDIDPKTSEGIITGDRLYKLIHDSAPGTHAIEIHVESGTLDVYTLTFG